MNTLLTILFIVLGIVALLLLAALFMKKDYNIQREITINAPQQKVFDYIRHLKNQDSYNKWVMVEPNMHKGFTGEDGTVGFIYAWNGKKAGEGEQEIISIDGDSMATQIRFVKPFPTIAYTNMAAEDISGNQTKVSWSNASTLKYPINLMLKTVEKMLAKDMDTSLSNLKHILEK